MGTIALWPRYVLGFDPRIWEQENVAHEDVWVELPRMTVLFFPDFLLERNGSSVQRVRRIGFRIFGPSEILI